MVLAVMSLLITLTMPSITSIAGGRDLANAVSITEDIASAAHQQALSRGAMVALLLSPTNQVSAGSPQNFVLLAANINGTNVTWTSATPFVQLPPTIRLTPFVRNGTPSFYPFSSTNSQRLTPPSSWNGHNLGQYSYIEFLPDGTVSAPASGPAINLQRSGKGETNVDYMILIQEASGMAKVIANQ
jgi:hypothetical protein